MRGIGNILLGVVFIIGGLSGKMVLIGTNSTVGIMAVGAALIAWGGWQAVQGRQAQD